MANKTVYLNGEYMPLNEAKVSVLDRGFLFGDGVYEVIPSYFGHLFHFQEHMERLSSSLAAIRIANPYSTGQWLKILTPLLDASQNQAVYVQITRGAAGNRDHAIPENIQPTVFAMCSNFTPSAGLENGVKAITLDDSRWQLCHVKAITLLANILHRQQAADQGCAEAILVNKDGLVTEGAASNVFALIDGILCTPAKDSSILPGITRDVIVELAIKNAIPCCEGQVKLSDLKKASEVWVTSTMREILPVIELDGETVGDGKPGPLWHQMQQLFQAYKQSLV